MDEQLHDLIGPADLDILQQQSAMALLRSCLNNTKLSTELFGTAREVVIVHEGEEYRLCITRNEKLILIK